MLALADEYELVLYDQRGGGKSRTDDPAPITWQTHVEDLAAVAAELDLGAPELIGYSWGGLLAMLYATEAAPSDSSPTAPTALILIDPAPVTREYRAQFEAEFSRRQQSEQIQRLRSELAASDLRERDPEAYRHRAFELSVAGYFADPERARDLTPFRVIGRVQQSVWGSLGDFDLVPQLRQVDLPAIVIHGREDPIPLASSEAVADALGARLVVIDDCGHVPYVEQPQSLFDAVREFLTESSPLPQRDAP
jgi:proline iminopeptidase